MNLILKPKKSIRFALLEQKDLPAAQQRAIARESTIIDAPWDCTREPRPLPEHWEKHRAEQNINVDYLGQIVTIPTGCNYFTYEGKVALGWHGSYNPPHGM